LSSQYSEKSEIIRELGEEQLLLPKLISEALSANDAAKYFLALIQAARDHADHPDEGFSDLSSEREACGIGEKEFDMVVQSSRKLQDGTYEIPNVGRLADEVVLMTDRMIAPLRVARGDRLQESDLYETRKTKLLQGFKAEDGAKVSVSFVETATSVNRDKDSFHLLVMDLHRSINDLQSKTYQEVLDGANVYGIDQADAVLVRAFMKGLNQSAELKFDHPGLSTSATRAGDALLIQNDIGQTDSHIIVIKVIGLSAILTYTDVHPSRLVFFQSLLEKFPVKWNGTISRKGEGLKEPNYQMCVGVLETKNPNDLAEYLSFLGSRIVFLIDWNRARKQLRNFVGKNEAVQILRWAADKGYGHRGFLKMGGAQLIYGIVDQAKRSPFRYGDDFSDVLGKDRAVDFLKFTLRTCTEGLLQSKSEFLIRDEVRVELTRHFHGIDQDILEIASEHATQTIEIAAAVRDGLIQVVNDDVDSVNRNAERARKWESRADSLLNKGRQLIKRTNAPREFEAVLSNADDAADALEDATFLLTQTSKVDVPPELFEPLLGLAELSNGCAKEHLKVIENAKTVRYGSQADMEDFLQSVDRVTIIEHEADDSLRVVTAALLKSTKDFRQIYLLSAIANKIEDSTDSFIKAALILKDYALEEMTNV
jgi:uncharacterized protein Yka (UPF0111/DUF47 family)